MDAAMDWPALEWATQAQAQEGHRLYGLYPATVVKIKDDPDNQGRVRVTLPWSPDGRSSYEAWARLATLMGGKDRGTWFIPDVGDEVLVGFEAGDPRSPCVVGGLWNGKDAPPETMDGAGRNNKKVIASRRDIRIILDDAQGQETLTLQTPGGQKVILTDGPASIEIRDSNGNSLKMDSSGITLRTSGTLTIQATTVVETASSVTVNTPQATFSGIVNSMTNITATTISSVYSPGAGNIW